MAETAQIEKVENGFVVRLFDRERTARFYLEWTEAAEALRLFFDSDPNSTQRRSTALMPALHVETGALERRVDSVRWARPTMPPPVRQG